VLAGRVDRETAANAATNKHDFLVSLEQADKRKRADEAAAAEPRPVPVAEEAPAPQLVVANEAPSGLRIVPAG
jgi:hypothetical protein